MRKKQIITFTVKFLIVNLYLYSKVIILIVKKPQKVLYKINAQIVEAKAEHNL